MLAIDPALLSSLAHPCIGAFIGYLTNKIAIRMLFRPLRPWSLFGIRVPMTPGIIPAKRHALAVNIGEMVGNHLLTGRDIGAAISGEPFQDHLAHLVNRKVQEVFKRDLGPLPDIVPVRFRSYFQVGVKTVKYQVAEGVNRYLAGNGFEEKITSAIVDRLQELGDRQLNSLLDPENRRAVYLFIDELLGALLASEQTETWLADHLAAVLRQAADRGHTVGDVVPEQLTALARGVLREQAAPLLERMGAQLADPVLRAQVVKGILAGVDHFLENLGPVGAMAKGFLEMDTVEAKIHAYLDEKEADWAAWLRNPEVQERMTSALEAHIESLLAKRLDIVLAGVDEERLTALCRTCANQLLAACQSEGALTGLRALLHVGMEHVLEGGERPLGELATQFLPEEGVLQLRAAIVRECLGLFRSGACERLVHSMVNAMVDTLLARPLGQLYDIVPHGVRQGLVEYSILTANRMLLQEVPGVVESLNIKRVVTDKVDSLDLLQLERLLLSIMEEQFKYINLFGALLGFLIGLINLALVKLA